jgi:3-oxoadipate enol-lactonase
MLRKSSLSQLALGGLLMTFGIENFTAMARAEQLPVRQVILGDHATSLIDSGGEGSPVILIHALSTDHRMWSDMVARLASRHRVIAYDVRGHGAAKGAPKPYSVDIFASDLKNLLDALHISRAHIYGISMGGAIAQQFAISYPERVTSLALIATFSNALPAFAARGLSGMSDGMAAQIVPTLTRWFTPAALAINGPGVQYARAMLLNTQPDDWLASWRALSEIAYYSQLASVRAPTKVVAGELDAAFPPELMKKDIAMQIPGAHLIVIPGAAHMIALEKGSELATALLE